MIRTIQNAFVSGEIAPTLHGRHDLKAYFSGAELLDNWIVRKAGGLQKRQGTDIAMDLTGYEGGRIIPFFYDRTTCVLILLHGQLARFIAPDETGALAFIQADGSDYTVATYWQDAALPTLKAYQLGDTLYLSAPGCQACKLVRTSAAVWTLTYLTGVITVPVPPTLYAAASGFDDSGTSESTADYALYAVKDGVYSTPKKKSAAITLPWAVGAKVTLSFTPDLTTGVDGYVLGKKTGAYYGVLSEMYPTREQASLTGKTYATSGLGSGSDYLFSTDHAADLRAADPNAKTTKELLLNLSAYAIHAPRVGSAAPELTYSHAASAVKSYSAAHIWFGATAANAAKQHTATVDYTSAAPHVKIEMYISSAWVTVYDATPDFAAAAAGEGYIACPISETRSGSKSRFTFTPADANDTGVVLRGIAILDRAGTPAYVTIGSWAATSTDYDFYAAGVSGWTSLADHYATADLEVVSDADGADRDSLAEVSCVPTRTLSVDATPVNLNTAEEDGLSYSTVRLTQSAAWACAEIRIWLGTEAALTPLYTPGVKNRLPSATESCRIQYTVNGSTWTTLPEVYSLPDQYAAEPISITVPYIAAETLAAVTGWGLKILGDPYQIIRGCQFLSTTIVSTFIDQNHSPTELIDSQTYLSPGSSDMDVDLVGMHQQRLVLAASDGLPFTLWFSALAEIGMFYAGIPLTDTSPFEASIPATRASRILHMLSDRRLILFTEGGIYTVEGSESEGFSYRTCRIAKVANCGACSVEPVAGQNTVLFVQEDARTLTELRYDLAQDGIIPLERSVLAGHLTEASPIARLAWQAAPNNVLWLLLADGSLLSFTYMPEHEVYAWARHTLPSGLVLTDLIAPGSVESGTDTETSTTLYATATLGAKTLLLRLRPQIASSLPAAAAAASLDLCQSHTLAAPASSVTPAVPYPSGAAVTAVNTATAATYALTSGGAALTGATLPAGAYLLGVPVSATLRTLRPELPDRNIQGLRKNIVDTTIRVHRTRHLTVGPADVSAAAVQNLYPAAAAAAAGHLPLLSTDLQTSTSGGWNRDGRLTVTSADGWPAEILSVITELDLESR